MTEQNPFDIPLDVDPLTGEILETPQERAQQAVLAPAAREPGEDAGKFLQAAVGAVGALDGQEFGQTLRRMLVARVSEVYQEVRDQRPVGDGLTDDAVKPELRMLTRTAESLRAVGAAFVDTAKDAELLAGEVVLEVRAEKAEQIERSGGTTSMRFGDGQGGAYKATVSQPTQAFADDDALLDVVRAHLVGRADLEHLAQEDSTVAITAFSDGAKAMAEALFTLLASPKWKTTALDALGVQMEREEEYDLAARLTKAYGRRPHGSANVRIENVPQTAPRVGRAKRAPKTEETEQ